jgi:hypothetical protein
MNNSLRIASFPASGMARASLAQACPYRPNVSGAPHPYHVISYVHCPNVAQDWRFFGIF